MEQTMSFLTLSIVIKNLKYNLDVIESTVINCGQKSTNMYHIINIKT